MEGVDVEKAERADRAHLQPAAYSTDVLLAAIQAPSFVQLSIRGISSMPYHEAVVRPVTIKGKRQLQASYFDERQHVCRTLDASSSAALEELLAVRYSSLQLRTNNQDINLQVCPHPTTRRCYS